MFASWIPRWLKDSCRRAAADRARFYRPQLEALEDRAVPSTATWDGGSSSTSNWMDRFNWVKDIAPSSGDDLYFPSGAARLTNTNNFPSGTVFNSLDFGSAGYTIGSTHTLNLGAGGILASAPSRPGLSSYNGPIQLDGQRIIDVVTGSFALGGLLSGAGDITKTGAGKLILNTPSSQISHISEIDVAHGTVLLNGDFVGNAVLSKNGTLGGQGRLLGTLTPADDFYQVLDNGDSGFSASGWSTSTSAGFDGDLAFAGPSYQTGTVVTATWAFTGLAQGLYRVFATWPGGSNHTIGAPFSMLDNTTLRATAFINQETASAGGPNEFGFVFQQLSGSVTINSGTLKVTLSNAVASPEKDGAVVVADAIHIERLSGAYTTGGGSLQIGASTADVSELNFGTTFQVDFLTTASGENFTEPLLAYGDLNINRSLLVLSANSFTPPTTAAFFPIIEGVSGAGTIDGVFENAPHSGDTIDLVVGTTRHTFRIDYIGEVDLTYVNTATQVSFLDLSPGVINEGESVRLRGALTDPNAGDVLTLRVDWGDGIVQTITDLGTKPFLFTHTYADNSPAGSPYLVRVEWFDQHGAGNGRDLFVTVHNVPPLLFLGSAEVIHAGEMMYHTANFTDPGADTWTATVDYGDGSGPQPLAIQPDGKILLAHRYQRPGIYRLTVTLLDDDGGLSSDTFLVIVLPLR